jgi:hypothetical protein
MLHCMLQGDSLDHRPLLGGVALFLVDEGVVKEGHCGAELQRAKRRSCNARADPAFNPPHHMFDPRCLKVVEEVKPLEERLDTSFSVSEPFLVDLFDPLRQSASC